MKLKRNLCLGPRHRLQGARSVVRISGIPVGAVASRFRQSIVCSPSTAFVRKLSRVGFAPRTTSFIVASEARLAPTVAAQRGVAVRSGSSVPNKSLEPTPVRNVPSLSVGSGAAQLSR